MRRRNQNAAPAPVAKSAPPSVPTPPAKPRGRRLQLALFVAAVGLLGFAAWWLWATDPLTEARAALDRRDFTKAEELLSRRLADRPDDGEGRLLAVQTMRRKGALVSAAGHLRKYQEKHGGTPESERESRLLRAYGSGAEADRLLAEYRKDPDARDSHQLLEAYLEGKLRAVTPPGAGRMDPNVDVAALAVVAACEPDLHAAVDAWLAARSGRADQAQGRVWRARIYMAANKHAEAVAALREAVELAPDDFEARFQLALGVSATAPDEARRHLETLRASHPTNPYVRLGLANTYRMLGRGADARSLYEGLLADRLGTDALVELGTLDLDEGKLDDAGRRLREALATAPNSPGTNLAMSRYHQLAGRPDEAVKFRTKFEELDAARTKHAPK